jgi:hypothetical protein
LEYIEHSTISTSIEVYSANDELDILHNLKIELGGVLNSYLEQKLKAYAFNVKVVGPIADYLFECPCCHSYSLTEPRGNHDICMVCWWHDDGTVEEDKVSGANHMTLKEAKQNFERLGICTEKLLSKVVPLKINSKYPTK